MIRRGVGRKSVDQTRIGASAITWLESYTYSLFLFARFTSSLSPFPLFPSPTWPGRSSRSLSLPNIPNIANRVYHRDCNKKIKNNQKRIFTEQITRRSNKLLNNSSKERRKTAIRIRLSPILLFAERMNYERKEWESRQGKKGIGNVKHLGNTCDVVSSFWETTSWII